MNRFFAAVLTLAAFSALELSAQRLPVIDVHLHAYTDIPAGVPADWTPRPETQEMVSPDDMTAHMQATLAQMDQYNIVLGVVSGPEEAVRAWQEAAPGRFIGGAFFGDDGLPEHSVDALRELVDEGVIGVLGELGLQYFGLTPDDPRLDPYYDYLEESGVPLALHMGLGPPGGPHSFAPDFRAALGRPLLFEPVIAVRPGLKAYIMHAGWPWLTETKAMMYIYPDLYADIGVLAWALTKEAFYSALKELVEAGLGDRLMFGTDQMMWPDAIGIAIETVETAPFLSEQQKRAILYDNAARFLELDKELIEKHHEK